MAGLIEDYAVIGDTQTVGLIDREGSIAWLCFPRFDSPACFAALLGDEENGHWTIAPASGGPCTSRRYVAETLVLESIWETDQGTVRLFDLMPQRGDAPDVVRIVEGVRGQVDMEMTLRLRFEYGRRIPWLHRTDDQVVAMAGPDAVYLRCDVDVRGQDMSTVGSFTVAAGERKRFVLTWKESHKPPPDTVDADQALDNTVESWRAWASKYHEHGKWHDPVVRSLLTLKALTFEPTGGIVAAATTSLPEEIGGGRNWDYRYCWLRDATMTLEALLRSGFTEEAAAWRDWLLRAVGGAPNDLQIMYGIAGETRLTEYEADWLSGYEGSKPVRIGNAAAGQLQLDVYGEVIDALALAERHGVEGDGQAWSVMVALTTHLEGIWNDPDQGLWEIRGEPRQFTHSKLMCWVAFYRMSELADERGDDRADHWRQLAETVHADICANAWDDGMRAFTQSYGSTSLDAAVLMMVRTGFLSPEDERLSSTIDAIQKHLDRDGLLLRYRLPEGDGDESSPDGIEGGEGAFLACAFWLAEALQLVGRHDEALELFERLLALRNDLGLLAEEYDTQAQRQVGNVPQAFSHIGLVNTACTLAGLTYHAVEEARERSS